MPLSYRRILGLVDYDGHAEVIRSHLAKYPGFVVDEWLTEVETLRLIESISPVEVDLSSIARRTEPPPREPEDLPALERDVSLADVSLSRLGVYVAHERISNRPASSKRAKDTVALIVEDDPDQRALAVRRLSDAGYGVRTANGVQTCLHALRERSPDAIFLDVELPDGNGLQVLSMLRRHPSYTRLPVIMLTARSEPRDVARGLAFGADGYVTKPYGRNSLDYLLRYVMNQAI